QVVYRTPAVFEQTAQGVQHALGKLGINAETYAPGSDDIGDRFLAEAFQDPATLVIVICYQLFTAMPRHYILLQLEQPSADMYVPAHLPSALAVWDFSSSGLSFLKRVMRVPASFMTVYTAIPSTSFAGLQGEASASIENTLVFFNGWLSERRLAIMQMIAFAGVPLDIRQAYGSELDERVHRANIVLNLHKNDGAALEVHRLNRLLLQGKCIVSETSSDPILDAIYSGGVVFAHKDELVEVLLQLLGDDTQRRRWEANASSLGRTLHSDLSPLQHGLMQVASSLSE
ncbi:hypothetical protein JKP88DRAFT_306709, partial [Tribonema minus]